MTRQTLRRIALLATVAAAAFLAGPSGARAASITGAGATFPYPIYAKWAEAYRQKTGVGVNYQSIGSGGGIKQISVGTVDFGASDAPLGADELEEAGLVQFPTVMGGVVPVVNLRGFGPGQLRLTGQLLADIFLGKIERWNDPAIARANPGVVLPDRRITVVHRSDGSGTTFIFTSYLSKVSPDWKESVGVEKAVSWPTGIGGKGNEGVASYVQRVNGAIGYVEYAYALQNRMSYVLLENRDGRFVRPDSESFRAAAAAADWAGTPGFGVILTNQPGEKSWPIVGATFILMHRSPARPETAREVLRFFDWAYRHGDAMAEALDYVPMPDRIVTLVQKIWKERIRAADGSPIWTVRTAAGSN